MPPTTARGPRRVIVTSGFGDAVIQAEAESPKIMHRRPYQGILAAKSYRGIKRPRFHSAPVVRHEDGAAQGLHRRAEVHFSELDGWCRRRESNPQGGPRGLEFTVLNARQFSRLRRFLPSGIVRVILARTDRRVAARSGWPRPVGSTQPQDVFHGRSNQQETINAPNDHDQPARSRSDSVEGVLHGLGLRQ
jgi:hypothetical protein